MLNTTDYVVILLMTVVLIIGIYQFYFWCQRNVKRKPTFFDMKIDNLFPYHPWWIWIYSGLYYPVIIYIGYLVQSMRQFNYIVFSYFLLLFAQMIFFIFFPVQTPNKWRDQVKGKTLSEKFLLLVQKYDAPTNCFPSMHVSFAMLTALHILSLQPLIGLWILLFPFFIALSALYTKQHYFIDLIPGALLGWGLFEVYQLIL